MEDNLKDQTNTVILFCFPLILVPWSLHDINVRAEGPGGPDVNRDAAGLHVSGCLCPGAQVSETVPAGNGVNVFVVVRG